MSRKRQSSLLQPQGPGETGRWAVPRIVILGLFYRKIAAVWHFLSKYEVFAFTESIGESECDAEGGASNFFAKFLFGKLSLHYLFERIHRCLLQPLHA